MVVAVMCIGKVDMPMGERPMAVAMAVRAVG
jgi:hypothetical protein